MTQPTTTIQKTPAGFRKRCNGCGRITRHYPTRAEAGADTLNCWHWDANRRAERDARMRRRRR